jgi:inorganic pyrophosphatase
MAKKKPPKNAFADPSVLSPRVLDDKELIQVIIETPKSSRNKFAFDDDQKVFELKKVLPAGMTFPHDFGFIPSTKAEDGDPTDVLVLIDEPAYPGCLIKCRPIGIIVEDRPWSPQSFTGILRRRHSEGSWGFVG